MKEVVVCYSLVGFDKLEKLGKPKVWDNTFDSADAAYAFAHEECLKSAVVFPMLGKWFIVENS